MGYLQRHAQGRQPSRHDQLDESAAVVFLGTDRAQAEVSCVLCGGCGKVNGVLTCYSFNAIALYLDIAGMLYED